MDFNIFVYMAKEIERKYLVSGEFRSFAYEQSRITQGYISNDPERTVRIRIRREKGYITIKGLSSENGLSRYEWEKEITLVEAEELIQLCLPGVIDKVRYLIRWQKHIIEVDEFYGDNQGLVMAEVELSSEDDVFEKPDFLGEEVTGDIRYYNSQLQKHPYTTL